MERNDLSTLAVFLAVAEERSFTKAGKRLGVSPSAMSHAIRGLEEDLGGSSPLTHDAQRRADGSGRAAPDALAPGAKRCRGCPGRTLRLTRQARGPPAIAGATGCRNRRPGS